LLFFFFFLKALIFALNAKPQETPTEVKDVFEELERREKNKVVDRVLNRNGAINAKFWKLVKALHVCFLFIFFFLY
jgi:hypothetical protein